MYLKRAMLDRSLFGSPAAHRRRIAADLDAAEPSLMVAGSAGSKS